jgi:hypothetical protein
MASRKLIAILNRGGIMKHLLVLLSLSLITTSCVTIDGNLLVTEKMTLKKKGGFLNLGRKNVDIEANQYHAHLTPLGKDNFTLILQRGDERISIPLKSKTELKVPSYDGEFKISHNDIDQPYDLKGLLHTDVRISDSQEAIESCTWDTTETRCHVECKDEMVKDDKGVEHKENHCQKLCENFTITHNGRHEVEFHYSTTTRDLAFSFLKADSSSEVAHFQGQDVETNKIIERQGICN